MTFTLLSIACFVAAFALDAIEAVYVKAVGDGRAALGAACSIGMYIIGCVGFFSILAYSWWLMVPEVLGLACGSVWAIRKQGPKVPPIIVKE